MNYLASVDNKLKSYFQKFYDVCIKGNFLDHLWIYVFLNAFYNTLLLLILYLSGALIFVNHHFAVAIFVIGLTTIIASINIGAIIYYIKNKKLSDDYTRRQLCSWVMYFVMSFMWARVDVVMLMILFHVIISYYMVIVVAGEK